LFSYIHGGAWRDPTVTAASFNATESILRNTNLPISGFASISYRLSPHPNHPQDSRNTAPNDFQDAKHPDHIRDVEAALAFLQNTYGFGARYILVGHSCGATLAFQAVMGAISEHREQAFTGGTESSDTNVGVVSASPGPLPPPLTAQPIAIVGVAGIYDLRRLRDSHRDISAYREFLEGAFGTDELLWDGVSPAQMVGSRGVEGGWKSGRLAVLAHSKDDELVDESQMEVMKEALRHWEQKEAQIPVQELSHRDRRLRLLSISGAHDEAWEQGDQLARAVKFAFEQLQEMGLAPQS
jgi:acetyl esterase/lipase